MTTETPDTTTTAPTETPPISGLDVQNSLHNLMSKMVTLAGDMRHVLITVTEDGVSVVSGMRRDRCLILLRATVEELEALEASGAEQKEGFHSEGPEAA